MPLLLARAQWELSYLSTAQVFSPYFWKYGVESTVSIAFLVSAMSAMLGYEETLRSAFCSTVTRSAPASCADRNRPALSSAAAASSRIG